uniref:Uncharacterized protein n=1 Tax=Tanacetum cinerariifolium TaxID=118510 RepID=A0A699GES1_TANCI|nr:hypothetical protein [Tanacetum cinerariifolium]
MRALLDVTLAFTVAHADRIRALRLDAREQAANASEWTVNWKLDDSNPSTFRFKGYAAKRTASLLGDYLRLSYDRSAPWEKDIAYYNSFVPAATVRAPKGYIVPQAWREAVERLKWNGVQMAPFDEAVTIEAQYYHIASVTSRPNAYEGHLYHDHVELEARTGTFTVQAGDWFIPLKQPNARYAVETLEPQGHDSFFRWGFFNSVLEKKEAYSDYVFEDLAMDMLATEPALQAQFDAWKAANPALLSQQDKPLFLPGAALCRRPGGHHRHLFAVHQYGHRHDHLHRRPVHGADGYAEPAAPQVQRDERVRDPVQRRHPADQPVRAAALAVADHARADQLYGLHDGRVRQKIDAAATGHAVHHDHVDGTLDDGGAIVHPHGMVHAGRGGVSGICDGDILGAAPPHQAAGAGRGAVRAGPLHRHQGRLLRQPFQSQRAVQQADPPAKRAGRPPAGVARPDPARPSQYQGCHRGAGARVHAGLVRTDPVHPHRLRPAALAPGRFAGHENPARPRLQVRARHRIGGVRRHPQKRVVSGNYLRPRARRHRGGTGSAANPHRRRQAPTRGAGRAARPAQQDPRHHQDDRRTAPGQPEGVLDHAVLGGRRHGPVPVPAKIRIPHDPVAPAPRFADLPLFAARGHGHFRGPGPPHRPHHRHHHRLRDRGRGDSLRQPHVRHPRHADPGHGGHAHLYLFALPVRGDCRIDHDPAANAFDDARERRPDHGTAGRHLHWRSCRHRVQLCAGQLGIPVGAAAGARGAGRQPALYAGQLRPAAGQGQGRFRVPHRTQAPDGQPGRAELGAGANAGRTVEQAARGGRYQFVHRPELFIGGARGRAARHPTPPRGRAAHGTGERHARRQPRPGGGHLCPCARSANSTYFRACERNATAGGVVGMAAGPAPDPFIAGRCRQNYRLQPGRAHTSSHQTDIFKELHMNTTIFNYHTTNANFAHDVANAVRQLFVSLFAKKPAGVATDMEIRDDGSRHPDRKDGIGGQRQAEHQVQAGADAQARHHVRTERHAETGGRVIALLVAQHRHGQRHHDECRQRAHADHVPQEGRIDKTGHQAHDQAHDQRVLHRRRRARVDLLERLGNQAILRDRVQDAGLAINRHQRHAEHGNHGARRQHQRGPGLARDVLQDHGQAGFLAGELRRWLRAHGGKRHQHIKHGHDCQCRQNADRHVAGGVAHFLAGSGHRVETDKREEHGGRGRRHAGHAGVMDAVVGTEERVEVVDVETRKRDHDEKDQDRQLDQHHHGVGGGRFLGAADQQHAAQNHQQDRRQIHVSRMQFDAVAGVGHDHRRAQHLRDMPAERVIQEIIQVVGPADGGSAGSEAVLQQQAGGHDKGQEFAHGRIRKRVRRTGRGDAKRQLGVAQRGEPRRNGCNQERQHHGWPGLGYGFDHGKENAGADGGAHPDHGEGKQSHRTVQAVAGGGGFRPFLLGSGRDRLGTGELLDQRLIHSDSLWEICSGKKTKRL